MTAAPQLNVETIRATVVKVGYSMSLPPALLRSAQLHSWDDYIGERLVVGLSASLAGSGQERVTCRVRWPADWWEAVKERFAPAWFLRRWPVRYDKHVVDRVFYRAMCPHIDIPDRASEMHWKFLKGYDE